MRATYLKLAALLAISALATAVLVSLLSDSNVGGPQVNYHAIVSDASLLAAGNAVRIAGVDVGQVRGLKYLSDHRVRIDFSVRKNLRLPGDVHAVIRYKNLIGARILVLTNPGDEGPGIVLASDATIPLARTEPALDLDALTGGFKPLLEALDPDAVNKLSASVLALVQGDDGSVQQTMQAITDVTTVIADHGGDVDQLITNLDSVMTTTALHSTDLGVLIDGLQRLVRRANEERQPILDAVRQVGDFSAELATLLKNARPPISTVVQSVSQVARTMNQNSKLLTDFLAGWGPAYKQVAGIGVYGDFFNFYLCDVQVKATGPNGKPIYTPWVNSGDARCDDKRETQ